MTNVVNIKPAKLEYSLAWITLPKCSLTELQARPLTLTFVITLTAVLRMKAFPIVGR